MNIARATIDDMPEWTAMASDLWPDDAGSMESILRGILASEREDAFICRTTDGLAIGFINLSVRSDYVEGANTSPVGFVEGIYVKPDHRGGDVGRRLIEAAERWTVERGMTELGSDAPLENTHSHAFHEAVGFTEAGRNVWFIKRLS